MGRSQRIAPAYSRVGDQLGQRPVAGKQPTQFIKRITEFADRYNLKIHLVYYPSYHSKYNPVERLWGILENHWNGTLLVDRETVIEWAKTMTWKGISPIVRVLDKVFETGVKVAKKEFTEFQKRITRNPLLPKRDVQIQSACEVAQPSG